MTGYIGAYVHWESFQLSEGNKNSFSCAYIALVLYAEASCSEELSSLAFVSAVEICVWLFLCVLHSQLVHQNFGLLCTLR